MVLAQIIMDGTPTWGLLVDVDEDGFLVKVGNIMAFRFVLEAWVII